MFRITVHVTPNARKNSIEKYKDGLKLKVNAPPAEGRANKAVIELLAEYFGVRKSAVRIVKGEKGRDKIFEIGE